MSKLDYHIKYHSVKPEVQEYPCIMQHKTDDSLWLFIRHNEATCLTGIKIGKFRDNASPVCYKPFIGAVTITQE